MSNLTFPLPVVEVKQALLDFVPPSVIVNKPNNLKSFLVNETQTYSNSATSTKLEISNADKVVDRNVIWEQPLDVEVIGSTSTGANILIENTWGFRSQPLSKILNTIQINYGNNSYTFNCADIISMLERYNSFNPDKYVEDLTLSQLDNCQDYSDLYGANRNPLSMYSEGKDNEYGRCSQPIWGVGSDPNNPKPVENTPTSAKFSTVLRTCLISSPLLDKFRKGGASFGLAHLTNIDIQMTFVSNLGARLLSFMRDRGGDILTITAINITIQKPKFRFVQVSDKETIPPVLSYNLNTLQRFPIDCNLPRGVQTQVNSQVIQLDRIPNYLMIGARPSNNVWLSNNYVDSLGNTWNGSQMPDAFAQITNLNIQLDGQDLLSNADVSQLYKMAVQNNLVDNFIQFAGVPVPKAFTGKPQFLAPSGSVLKLRFGEDLSLYTAPNLAPGVAYKTNLTVNATFVNQCPFTDNFTFYLVLCYDDILQLTGSNDSRLTSAPLSQADVANARNENIRVHYDVLRNHNLAGAGFLSGLSNIIQTGKKALPILKDIFNSPVGQFARDQIKKKAFEYNPTVGNVLKQTGFGMSGGAVAHKSHMRKSLFH